MMKKIVLSFLLLFAIPSYGLEWVGPYTIKEVWSWANDGYGLTSIVIKEKDQLNTGCKVTDSTGLFSLWQGSMNLYNSNFLSTLFYADSQEKKIMIWLDNSCSSWAGKRFFGVKVLKEESEK